MKHRLLFWLVLLSAAWAHTSAAAIITATLTNTSFCRGATVQVLYTVDVPFSTNNVFTAQLSDETGSFAAPVSIGALAGTAGGTITATLPQNAVTGAAYRVRVVASSPSTVGADNGTDLTITNIGAVTAGSNGPPCVGGNLLLTATAVPGASYSWTGPAGFTSLLQNPTIANVDPNRSGTYTVTASLNGCTATSQVTVTVNPATSAAPTVSVQYNGPTTTLTSSAAPAGGAYQWYLNGQPISGATAQTYVVTGSAQFGSYTVVVTSAQGCASPASAPLTVTAAADPLAAAALELYPNPTRTGRLTLTLTGYAKPLELSIFDAVGRVVYRASLRPAASGATQELDLSPLPVGAYLLRASSADGTLIRRIVRQ
ncbi:T9SS type A sorting domain-containing protein [Hymenobacter gummosus]|nr:T9SS type A sorting domain-containing protein [Hymenobacter gummosus]